MVLKVAINQVYYALNGCQKVTISGSFFKEVVFSEYFCSKVGNKGIITHSITVRFKSV